MSFFPIEEVERAPKNQKWRELNDGVFHSGGFSDRLELGKILEFEFETFQRCKSDTSLRQSC